MGSINALVSSCGTANHLPHRRGGDMQQRPTDPRSSSSGNRSLFPQVPPWLEGWQQSGCKQIQFHCPDLQRSGMDGAAARRDEGNGARMRTWRRTRPLAAQHPLAGKRTAKAEARDRSQAEVDKHESQKITTPIYMRGEETRIFKKNNKWHTAINTSAACIVPYITKKRSIYKNQYPLLLVRVFFFEQKHSFLWG